MPLTLRCLLSVQASLKTAKLPKSTLALKRAIALQNGVSEPDAAATEDSSAGPGLQNETGEYNCFLNVVVQCLWHCRAFRDAFLSLNRRIIQVSHSAASSCSPTLMNSVLPIRFSYLLYVGSLISMITASVH